MLEFIGENVEKNIIRPLRSLRGEDSATYVAGGRGIILYDWSIRSHNIPYNA